MSIHALFVVTWSPCLLCLLHLLSAQALVDNFKRYEVLARECNIARKPKLHMFMHMTAKALTDGNPAHLAWFLG